MPNVPKGEVRWTEHGAVARITIEGKERESQQQLKTDKGGPHG